MQYQTFCAFADSLTHVSKRGESENCL